MGKHRKKTAEPQSRRAWLWDRLCEWFIYLMAVVYILGAVPYGAISRFKFGLFLILTGSFAALAAALWIWDMAGGHRDLQAARARPAELCALLYLLFTVLSAVFSPYTGTFLGNDRWDGVLTIGLYTAVFLILSRHLRPNRRMMTAFGAAMCLYCLVGLVQLTGGNPFMLYPEGYDFYDGGIYYIGQFFSTTGNADLGAAILALAAGAFAGGLICAGERRDRLLYIPFCLCSFTIFELGVDAAQLALLCGLLLLAPLLTTDAGRLRNLLRIWGAAALSVGFALSIKMFSGGIALAFGAKSGLVLAVGCALLAAGCLAEHFRFAEGISAGQLRAVLAGGLGALMLAALAFVFLHDGFGGGVLFELHQLLHGVWDDKFGSGRLYIWRETLARVPERLLLGGGPDTLGFRGIEDFSNFNEALGIQVTTYIDAAHNEYLNILVNQGALALLAYLALLGSTCVNAVRRADSPATAVAGAAAMMYLIQAFFGISTPSCSVYLWLVLGMANLPADPAENQMGQR